MNARPDEPDDRHPDTVLVDDLTAYLNGSLEPSGADVIALLARLVAASGRPLLDDTWDVTADVTEDRHGLVTATVNAGPYTVRVLQPTDGFGDLCVAVTSNHGDTDHDSCGLVITVDGQPVLDPTHCPGPAPSHSTRT